MGLIGHEKIINFFEAASAKNRLASVFCFSGPAEVGKLTAAKNIIARRFGSTVEKLASHPDFYFLGRETDEKSGLVKKDIGVESIRALRPLLSGAAWSAPERAVIIDEAERLTPEAQNTLLKMLEEPRTASLIFLITENESALLPTVLSRSQIFHFSLVPEAVLVKFLETTWQCPPSLASQIARLSWGRPGRAARLAADPSALAAALALEKEWEEIRRESTAAQYARVEVMTGEKPSEFRLADQLQARLDHWIVSAERELRQRPTSEQVAIIDSLERAKAELRTNASPRLIMEVALLSTH